MGLKEVGKRNFGKGSNSPRWEGEFAEAGNNRFLKKVIMRRRKKSEAEKKTRLKALSFFLKGGRQRREA